MTTPVLSLPSRLPRNVKPPGVFKLLQNWHMALASVGLVAFLVSLAEPAHGADAYANALDKRFVTGPQESSTAQVAALEDGIRAQVQQLAQPAQLNSTAVPESVDSVFLWEMVMAFAVGIMALVFMRSWHKSLFPPATRRAVAVPLPAEDVAMAELVKGLHPGAQTPEGTTSAVQNGSSQTTATDHPTNAPAPAAPPLNETITSLSAAFQSLSKAADESAQQGALRELVQYAQCLKESCGLTGLRSIWLLASALHGLLKQFSSKASNMTPSAMRTAAAGIDLVELLSTRQIRPDLATNPPVRLLAVDDEPISRRAVAVAIKKIFNEPDVAPDGPSALALAAQHSYDVVFLDIEMPGMDGFEVCTRIHELESNRTTPVVFVTSHQDFQSRAKSAVVGANDLMGKPFQAFEIALKALTLVVRARADRETRTLLNNPERQTSITRANAPAAELCAAEA
jgi:CheY-like chemotaxis protein